MSEKKQNPIEALAITLISLVIVVLACSVFSFFIAWLLMLGLGNVGVNVNYIGSYPLAILISYLIFNTGKKN